MIASYRTRGFIFKKEDRQEADRVFTVFTQDFGRLEIFAKSIRAITSKLRPGVEIFSVAQLEFVQGKNRKTLTDALCIEKFKSVTGDPEKLAVAYKISKALDTFIYGQELDSVIWIFLMDIFKKLDDPKTNNKFLYYYFFWNFVGILGHSPELMACASCAKPLDQKNLYFSNKEGGLICGSHGEGLRILPDAVKVLRLIMQQDWSTLSRLKMGVPAKKLLKEVSDRYYAYLMSSYSHHV